MIPLYWAHDEGTFTSGSCRTIPRCTTERRCGSVPKILKAAMDDVRLLSVKVNIPVQLNSDGQSGFELVKNGTDPVPIEESYPYGPFTVGPRKCF